MVDIVLDDGGVPFGKFAGGGVGTEAPALPKGFGHATDGTVPVSLIGLDVVWTRVVSIVTLQKDLRDLVGELNEDIVIRALLREDPRSWA